MNKKVKSRQELANEFGVSTKTFCRWLRKEKIHLPAGFVTPKWQRLIYLRFGFPLKSMMDTVPSTLTQEQD